MDDDAPNEAFAELKTGSIGGWGLAQIAAGTGLAVYAMWVGVLQPGFRKVPLKLQVLWMAHKMFSVLFLCWEPFLKYIFQVPYIPASKTQVDNVMKLLRGRKGNLVDLGSGDGRIVSTVRAWPAWIPFLCCKWQILIIVTWSFQSQRSWKPISVALLQQLVMSSTPGLFVWPVSMHGEQAIMKKWYIDEKIFGRFDIEHTFKLNHWFHNGATTQNCCIA